MTASSDEIRGDWNNLKGTHYHLLYALWLLLRNEAANVYFYEGNDLLARLVLPSPTLPPDPTSLQETDNAPAITLYAERATIDIWIQLKSTKSSWSCSRLLEENLLMNFICNGFQSEVRNRAWRATLITQGMVKQADVKDFVNFPQKRPVLNAKLDEILESTRTRLKKEGWSASETSLPNLRRIALEVLSHLSDSEPIALETLKSDVNAELTRAYPDQEVVGQLEDLLIGALIRDTAPGPVPAKTYDSDWINIVAGKPIVNRGVFDQDPVAACSAAVDAFALEIGFDPKRFALRDRLQNALEQFMTSSKTVFVITGLSGSGKSWSCTNWALQSLTGELRLIISGRDMDHSKTLGELVQNRLRASTSAFWPAEQFLKRLATASELENRKSFTAIIDDLIPTGDLAVYRRDLARIVAECRSRDFKIVLTCQKQLWELHNLGTEISSNDVFKLSSEISGTAEDIEGNNQRRASSSKGQLHSFILGDFSPEEQRATLSKHLSPDRAKKVADHFRLPGFSLLRSPYLLSRYLEWHVKELEDSGDPPPFSVDELLDWHVNSLLDRVVTELSCSSADIEPAFSELVEGLWLHRPEGLPFGKALASLSAEFPSKGFEFLMCLRGVGLLTSSGPIRLADALIADRLFAKRVQRQLQNETHYLLKELHPESDSGVVTALIRDVASDSIFLSEYFLANNSGWASAVVLGLAQGSPKDWRALSLLTSLLTSEEEHVLEAAYSGLGQIGARGQRAWKWLAELYLGDHAKTWHRGSRALANAIEYIPDHVEAAIRTRLTGLLHIDEVFSTNRDRRRSWLLNGSLDPLRGVTHQSSAAAAQRVVNRYSSIADQGQEWFFTNDLDHMRGRIALFGDRSNLNTLLEELNSDAGETRYRAAYAIRIVAAERPGLVKDSLLRRIREERNFQVLARLLLMSFHLIASYSDDLLIAIKSSKAGDLNKPLITTGVTLSLLGNLASKQSQAAQDLLPERLHKHPAWARAFSIEMLAYAWWRCAEKNVSAKKVLQALSNTELKGTEKKFIPLALRGSAIALLGLMSVEQGLSADELTGRQTFYPNQQKQFLYVETTDFFQKNLLALRRHQDFVNFVDLLLQSVIEEEKAQVPFDPAKDALFTCASMCLELIAQTAAVMDDPLTLLHRLPRNWQSIRAATRLLELGRHDAPVVDFARESYVGKEHAATTQALEERRRCQAQLALLDQDSRSALNEQRQSVVKSIFIQSEGDSLGVATLAARQPENLLTYLEDNVQDEHDLLTLYYLVEQARTWPTLLVARLYSRMFNSSPIGRHEAADLCEQILAAVRSLPHSFIQEEYESVYSRIYELLRGNVLNLEPVQRPVDNLISQSHKLSIEILEGPVEATGRPDPKQQLSSFLYDPRGWLETGLYALKHNLLLQGTSYMMYFFPAARLSLVAAGAQLGLEDPAGSVMKARSETARIINDHSYLFHAAGIDEEDNPHATRAIEDLQNRAVVSPDDERLPDTVGTLLLLMNRLEEAETALKQSLSLPLSRGSMRAHTLKNLACVYARANDEAGCRAALEESNHIEPLDQKWLSEDKDLESVRHCAWFKTLTIGPV